MDMADDVGAFVGDGVAWMLHMALSWNCCCGAIMGIVFMILLFQIGDEVF